MTHSISLSKIVLFRNPSTEQFIHDCWQYQTHFFVFLNGRICRYIIAKKIVNYTLFNIDSFEIEQFIRVMSAILNAKSVKIS